MRLSLEDRCSDVGLHLLQILDDARTVEVAVLDMAQLIEKMFGEAVGAELLQPGFHGSL